MSTTPMKEVLFIGGPCHGKLVRISEQQSELMPLPVSVKEGALIVTTDYIIRASQTPACAQFYTPREWTDAESQDAYCDFLRTQESLLPRGLK